MQTAIQSERSYDLAALLERLHRGGELFISAASIPEELIRITPRENTWSVLDVVEHLGQVEKGMRARLDTATVNNDPPNFEMDRRLLKVGVDRSSPRQAPEHVKPASRFSNLADAISYFRERRQETIAFLESAPEDLRKKKVAHPIGELDGYQLFLLMALHCERHTLQIEEIKQCAAYEAAAAKIGN
jgi:DinB superfamily